MVVAMRSASNRQSLKSRSRVPERRRRRSADETRCEALASARKILIKSGASAVTLKAVADDIGTTHTNLVHHFGSAGALQSELMSLMVRELAAALMDVVAHVRSDETAPRTLVNMVFDAFDQGGAGALAVWISSSGNLRYLKPVRKAVAELVAAIENKFAHESGEVHLAVTSAVLFMALMAFGDSVIGEPLREMLGRDSLASRKLTTFLLPKLFTP
jgi:AcrR family transcriptional regulator